MLSLILSTAFAAAVTKPAPPPDIKFLSASAPTVQEIETILGEQPLTFASLTRNVKLSVIFARPLDIARVHIESCEKDWTDGINVYASPGMQHVFNEGGKNKLDAKLKGPLESLAIIFGRDADLCLKNLKFYDSKDVAISLKPVETLKSKSSSPLLFDQRPETVVTLDEPTTLTFDETKKFDRAFVWTGGSPLYAHSLKLKSESGWAETLPLRDSASDQEIIFRKPFSGKSMTIQAPNSGEVGEIRFALGTKVEAPHANFSFTKLFDDSGLARILDFDWVSTEAEPEKWKAVFRQDGTFFIRGFSEDTKQAHEYSAIGAYSILRADKGKMRVKLNGVRMPSGLAWDGVSCPFMCGSQSHVEGSSTITDSLLIEKLDEGSMIIRNRTPRAQRTLMLGDLKVRRAVDD
jgi:hypothetical protein